MFRTGRWLMKGHGGEGVRTIVEQCVRPGLRGFQKPPDKYSITAGNAANAGGNNHAFRTAANGPITAASDLGTLGGTYSVAYGVNDSGQAVGFYYVDVDFYHAFFSDVTGPMQDLNNLIPTGSGWVLQMARGINDLGQIAGSGIAPNGETHAFLLTPTVPEPASLSLLALGCLGLLARRRRA